MKLLILGGTGGTGRLLIAQALAAGHTVTALVRDPATAALSGSGLTVVKGDPRLAADVERVMPGHEAVMSALGAKTKTDPVVAVSAQATVAAMQKHGVKRLVWLGAGGVGDSLPQLEAATFVFSYIILPLFLKKPYANHLRAEEAIRSSGLEWTILRPVQLVDGPATGRANAVEIGAAKVSNLKITRADLAAFMLSELGARALVRKAPIVQG